MAKDKKEKENQLEIVTDRPDIEFEPIGGNVSIVIRLTLVGLGIMFPIPMFFGWAMSTDTIPFQAHLLVGILYCLIISLIPGINWVTREHADEIDINKFRELDEKKGNEILSKYNEKVMDYNKTIEKWLVIFLVMSFVHIGLHYILYKIS